MDVLRGKPLIRVPKREFDEIGAYLEKQVDVEIIDDGGEEHVLETDLLILASFPPSPPIKLQPLKEQ